MTATNPARPAYATIDPTLLLDAADSGVVGSGVGESRCGVDVEAATVSSSATTGVAVGEGGAGEGVGVSVDGGVGDGGTSVAVAMGVAVSVGTGVGVCVFVGMAVSVGMGVSVGVAVGGTSMIRQASSQKESLCLTGYSCVPLVYTVTKFSCAMAETESRTQASISCPSSFVMRVSWSTTGSDQMVCKGGSAPNAGGKPPWGSIPTKT